MQPRQNKKARKGRNNPNNRERTVTTLTEDPNSSYLVPKSSEDPPNNSNHPLAFNHNHNQALQLQQQPVMNQFQIQASAGNFPYPYNGAFGLPQAAAIHPAPAQPFYTNQGVRVPGNNDLEILQNLKQMILDGQHPLYRPTPQPAALAKLYLGPSEASSAPLYPEQQAQGQQQQQPQSSTADPGQMQVSNSTGSSSLPSALSGPPSPADVSRRPPRMQGKESWDPPRKSFQPPLPQSQAQQQPASSSNPNNVLHPIQASSSHPLTNSPPQNTAQEPSRALTNINTSNLGPGPDRDPGSSVPASAIVKTEPAGDHPLPRVLESPAGRELQKGRYDGPASTRSPRMGEPHSYSRPPPTDVTPTKGYYDPKEDLATLEARRRMPPPGYHLYDERERDRERERERDRALPPRMNSAAAPAAPTDMSMNVDRLPPSDDRYDRERERERYRYRDWPERERDRERERERERDSYRPPPAGFYDRNSRPPYPPDPRRPLEYERKRYEPELANNGNPDPRRLSDARAPPPPAETSGIPPHVEGDRGRGASLAASSNLPRDTRPPPPVDALGPPPNSSSTATAPPTSASTSDSRVATGTPSGGERDAGASTGMARPPAPGSVSLASTPSEQNRERPVDDRGTARPVPLEERLSRGTLQERLSAPVPQAARPDERPRQEAPPTAGAVPAVSRTVGPAPGDRQLPPQESSVQDRDKHDPRAERYTRPITPLPNEAAVPPMHRSSYPAPPPRAASVARERDDRRPPSPGPPLTTGRPPLPQSAVAAAAAAMREREYRERAERERAERERHDRASYSRPYDRPPGDAMDVDPRYPGDPAYRRPYSPPPPPGAERRPSAYPPSVSPRADYDPRYPPPSGSTSRDWYPPYDRRSRDWSQAEEDAYWKSRGYPPPPPADRERERERYERDAPSRAWDPRDRERDPRDYPPPLPAPARGPSPPRVYERPPSTYPPTPVDDRYPPIASREIDRTRPPPPPSATYAGRVRPHSPSPVRRVDDPRPPLKRPRDEYPPPPQEYAYPPAPPRGREYAPSPVAVGYYERPPPGVPGERERDYPPRERAAYPPPPPAQQPPPGAASYERPRSPGRPAASYARPAAYRPPEREYMPPPPSRPA